MAITPTIISPGIEIIERDESIRASIPVGTTVLIPGFASTGPTDEIINISSMDDFVQIYDNPTNAAERYFYCTVEQVLRSSAYVQVCRLPYGEGEGDTKSPAYTILAYPAEAYALKTTKSTTNEGVLSGNISIHVGKKVYRAKKGESFYFTPTSNHYITSNKTGATFLWVSTPPSF